MRLAPRHRGKAIATAALVAIGVAVLGALSTDLGPWYAGLQQPPWKPSDLWFGPVWTTIYALTAAAAVQGWLYAPTRSSRDAVLLVVALNAVLNIVWSLLFFRLRRPDWALVEVVPLALSIVLMMVVLGRHSRIAVLLLVPYLLWVGFAGVLNAAVVRLNGPFTGLGGGA